MAAFVFKLFEDKTIDWFFAPHDEDDDLLLAREYQIIGPEEVELANKRTNGIAKETGRCFHCNSLGKFLKGKTITFRCQHH